MAPLLRVRSALHEAYDSLGDESITDLAYLLDVEPSGQECIVVYVTVREGQEHSSNRKRTIEAQLRSTLLATNVAYPVYFRWRTDLENETERRRVITMGGLFDQPHSALR